MSIFRDFFVKEKPVFTGITRGIGGFGFGGGGGAGGATPPPEAPKPKPPNPRVIPVKTGFSFTKKSLKIFDILVTSYQNPISPNLKSPDLLTSVL